VAADTTAVIDKVIRRHRAAPGSLIAILQDIQQQQGHLSETAIRHVSNRLDIPPGQAFAVATFYGGFSLTPLGKNRIQVCHGTACHIRGSEQITEQVTRELQISPGQTSPDGMFSLHKVRCLGCCALAPVVKVNEAVHATVSRQQVKSILERYKK